MKKKIILIFFFLNQDMTGSDICHLPFKIFNGKYAVIKKAEEHYTITVMSASSTTQCCKPSKRLWMRCMGEHCAHFPLNLLYMSTVLLIDLPSFLIWSMEISIIDCLKSLTNIMASLPSQCVSSNVLKSRSINRIKGATTIAIVS